MQTENIWNQFQGQLLGFIQKRVDNRADAEDILQDVFVKVHLKATQLNQKEKLTAWVYQITRNAIVDFYRKQKKSIKVEHQEELLGENSSDAYQEFSHCLIPLLKQLPEKYKEALTLTEFGNLSQKEYAAQLGISYSGAKSRVQRAKTQLQTLFVRCCGIKTDGYGNIITVNETCNSCDCK